MRNSRTIHVSLPLDEASRLLAAKERRGRSRSWLVSQIIRQWLNDPRRSLPRDIIQGSAGQLTRRQRTVVVYREVILKKWTAARIAGRRRGRSIEELTADFIARLPDPVSRASLYNWDRRQRIWGSAGLIDRRSCPHQRVEKPADGRDNRRRITPAA
jgi:hypothetical protein